MSAEFELRAIGGDVVEVTRYKNAIAVDNKIVSIKTAPQRLSLKQIDSRINRLETELNQYKSIYKSADTAIKEVVK
jgi:hypothetical protein